MSSRFVLPDSLHGPATCFQAFDRVNHLFDRSVLRENAGRDEKSNYEGEWFDETFMNNLEINYERCIK